jgi:Zn ribbon nucleic-acid-binding protein
MATICKHPRVRIVSRQDDVEFVECLECGEVFDSEEFNDMAIEDAIEPEEAEADS